MIDTRRQLCFNQYYHDKKGIQQVKNRNDSQSRFRCGEKSDVILSTLWANFDAAFFGHVIIYLIIDIQKKQTENTFIKSL